VACCGGPAIRLPVGDWEQRVGEGKSVGDIAGLLRHNRRRFLGCMASSIAGAILTACSRGDAPTAVPHPAPTSLMSTITPSPPVAPRAPVSTPTGGVAVVAPAQRVTTAAERRAFISPLDPAWSYSHGPWARLPHPGWPTDRMVAVMSDAWIRGEKVAKGGVGRRCSIVTDSPSATLLAAGDGRTLSVSLDGAPAVRIGPLPTDGSRSEVPLFDNRRGPTRIELIFDAAGANDGLYVAAATADPLRLECENGVIVDRAFNVSTGAPCWTVSRAPDTDQPRRRLVVLGNGYAEGVGASVPGVVGCASLIGERLKVEAVNQGWDGTDVDVRSGGAGDPRNSGIDRLATDVIALQPTAVLLIYGLRAAASLRASWEYAHQYAVMLRTLRTALPSAPIFCSGFPPCNGDLSAAFVQEWNAAVRSAANTVDNCPFIEAGGWWGPENYYGGSGPVYVTGDKIHPNDAGHRFLADKYAAVITQHLG